MAHRSAIYVILIDVSKLHVVSYAHNSQMRTTIQLCMDMSHISVMFCARVSFQGNQGNVKNLFSSFYGLELGKGNWTPVLIR